MSSSEIRPFSMPKGAMHCAEMNQEKRYAAKTHNS